MPSVIYIHLCVFVLLNFAHIGTQDKDSDVSSHKAEQKHHLKPEDKYKKFEIHYSLKSVWDIINSSEFAGVPVVKKIKQMWNTSKPPKIIQKKPRIRRKNATTESPHEEDGTTAQSLMTTELYEMTTHGRLPGRQNPFILIEGTLTNTRRKLLRGLMQHTTFVYIRNFRQTPFDYQEKLGRYNFLKLKRAFVSLQFYITGRDIERVLKDRPVIMSGFWMRQAAEFIARKYQDISKLPSIGSEYYKWPDDLVRPDLVLFLHTPRTDGKTNEDTLKRLERVTEIYHRMDPTVIVLDQVYNELSNKQAAQLRKMVMEKLSKTYPHTDSFIKYKKPSTEKIIYKGQGKNRTVHERKHKLRTNVTLEAITENKTFTEW